jgi:hypothetical protein
MGRIDRTLDGLHVSAVACTRAVTLADASRDAPATRIDCAQTDADAR